MLLTCPKCGSGLQVPDGTTAMVRCPACKTVFAPSESASPESDDESSEEAPEPPRRKAKPSRDADDDESEKPRKKKQKEEDEGTDEEEKGDEPARRKRRRRDIDDKLTPEERAERRRSFERAAIGARLIWVSFIIYMLSMAIILIFYFQGTFGVVTPFYITVAGVLGIVNWLLAAIGVGLCISGPRTPGHVGYGIAAASAVAIHFFFLLVLVAQGKESSIGSVTDKELGNEGNARWGLLPTRLDATMFYLTAIIYHDEQGATPKGPMTLSMICGVLEMLRTVLIMMLLSCLARAALDEELSHKCTRAAGIASGGPGLIALIILVFTATMIETGAGLNMFTMILFVTVNMGVYSIIIGTIFPSFMASRDVVDACNEPFQSLIPQL